MFKIVFLFLLNAFVLGLYSQTRVSYNKLTKIINKKEVVSPAKVKNDFFVTLNNLESPSPSGDSYRSFLLRQKMLAKAERQKNIPPAVKNKSLNKSTSSELIIGEEIAFARYSSSGTQYDIYGGIPNDNTLAVSNGGIVLASVNSLVYAYDLNLDTAIFPDYRISLTSFVNGGGIGHYFDPKAIYDPVADRFILVLLKGNTPEVSELIVCFSTTNNPLDDWNVYSLPGNPLDNNRWTDFPAIAITKDKLYYTANLIVPDVSWQIGFDGSIIWEVPLEEGYNGASDLSAELYTNIKHNGSYIRNLHPVQGADGIADKMYFLSNRNFDISNDSIFVLDLEEAIDTNYLNINVYESNLNYGVPPNARQFGTDTSDATQGLQTNDARVLGAIKFDNEIQFVSNSVNPNTGFSSIYHGVLSNLDGNSSIEARIIGDSIKDFGYPNIAWSGNEACDREVIIGFNYTSFTDFPGMASIYCNNEREYSNVKYLEEGENYIERLGGGYERWGDYYGLQRVYNKPGHTYAFGYVGKQNKVNSGHIVEVISPDTNYLDLEYVIDPTGGVCNQKIELLPIGGKEPFTVEWSGNTQGLIKEGVCIGDTVLATFTDARGCSKSVEIVLPFVENNGELLIYPNPSSDWITIQFDLEEESELKAVLYDDKGALIKTLLERPGKKGTNELIFSTESMSAGNYIFTLLVNGEIFKSSSIIKN